MKDEIPENIEYLTSSSNRVTVLRSLVEGPGKPSELRDRLGIPRSTFQRILSELQDRNWAKKTNGAYSATPLGEYVEGYFSECVGTMSTLDELERFFEYVPFSEVDAGFEILVESEITVSDSYSPHAPMERILDALEDADEVRGIAPVITDTHAKAYHDAILDGTYVENVVQTTVADAIFSRYDEWFDDVSQNGRTETYIYEGELTLGLTIMDGTVFVGAYDDDGIARALLENDTDEMLEWAEAYHDRYKREAKPVDAYVRNV
ncbi:MAG: helix-turn-helix transcriptional regulator [Halobacteriales archaeon]